MWLVALTVIAMTGLVHAAPAKDPGTLRIGSKRFTESYILAEILAQTAAPATREPPRVLQGLGNTAIVFEALRAGSIDVYAEYVGTIAQEILKSQRTLTLPQLRDQLAPLGLGVDVPLGFNDGYALTMRQADAARLGIDKLSDLAAHPHLRFGLSNEFIGRADGWRGLAACYGLPQAPTGLDHGLAYDALAQGRTDVIDIYTTDAKIEALDLRVLVDDRNYFPRYDAVLLHRLDVPQRFPAAWAAIRALSGSIDEAEMIRMNARAELHGVPFDRIAGDHLRGQTVDAASGAPGLMGKLFGPDLLRLTLQHLLLVGVSVLVACAVAIPAGVAVASRPRSRTIVLGVASLLQTVPSLALLAVLISMTGRIGVLPALVALTLYALLPILRNTCTGLAEVPAGLRSAALALGLTPAQGLRLIDLPLARPTILSGIRTATSIAIGTATIAAFIGAGGFGERIVTGLALNDHDLLLAGALPAAAMALASELGFEAAAWRRRRKLALTPRQGASAASPPRRVPSARDTG
ncbi:glycine betaine ABC transporter substrate-binding protein [Pigmentiphaga litoralis]|uniref:glycine betaine ABC transporter substrate-binding protein n=1 Tax=Pigmentiphaga litoralis TaxID=516702 RepID=UPI003B4385F2